MTLDPKTIRACIEALPREKELPMPGDDLLERLTWLTASGHDGGIARCHAALESLLSETDPSEASEPKVVPLTTYRDGQPPQPPGDIEHSGYAETFDGRTFEDGVRAALEALPKPFTPDQGIDAEMAAYNDALLGARERITDLLPKPDKAKALVEAWIASMPERDISPNSRTAKVAAEFSQWMQANGHINEQEIEG